MRMNAFLKWVLLADAATCVAAGAALSFGAETLGPLVGLEPAYLRVAGGMLFPFAAFAAWLAMRPAVARAAVWAVIGLNALWVLDSLILAGTTAGIGQAIVLAQAAGTALLTALEYRGLTPTAQS